MQGFTDGWCSTMWDWQGGEDGKSFEVKGRKQNKEVKGSDKLSAPSIVR